MTDDVEKWWRTPYKHKKGFPSKRIRYLYWEIMVASQKRQIISGCKDISGLFHSIHTSLSSTFHHSLFITHNMIVYSTPRRYLRTHIYKSLPSLTNPSKAHVSPPPSALLLLPCLRLQSPLFQIPPRLRFQSSRLRHYSRPRLRSFRRHRRWAVRCSGLVACCRVSQSLPSHR